MPATRSTTTSATPASGPMSPRSSATRSSSARSLLGAVRRRGRLCRSCTSRASISCRPRWSRTRALGKGVRGPRAARDPDQPGRDRPDRRDVWKQEKLAEAAQEIAELGQGVALAPCDDGRTYGAVGKNLATAQQRLQPDGRQLRKPGADPGPSGSKTLGAGSAKALDTPPMVEVAPRPLTKLAAQTVERRAAADRRRVAALAK